MSPDQATEIGRRIINTMRPTPALPEWQEVLAELDFDAALRTFRLLRDRVDDGLRIAAFRAAYDRTTGADTQPGGRRPNPADAREHCEHCRGSGFEPGPSRFQTVNGEAVEYTTVDYCRCIKPRRTAPSAPTAPSLLEDF